MSNIENSVKSIFEHMDIKKIYHIDDFYEIDYKTNFLAQFHLFDPLLIKDFFTKNNLEYTTNNDIDKQTLLDNWEKLDSKEIEEILSKLNQNFIWDIQSSSTVEKIFKQVNLEKLSPSAWEEQKEQISQTLKDNKTLFLFDNDWGTGLENSGIKAIKELTEIPDIKQDNIMCGLYTHTVKPEEEFSKRDTLAEQEQVSTNNFLVISKQHNEESFVKSLRTTAIMPTLKNFKDKIHKHILDSSSEVNDFITNKLDIVDLEYITLDSSSNEGEWEPKALYRLHANRHIKEFRNKIFSDVSLQEDIKTMRNLKNLSGIKSSPYKTKEIMKDELYDEKVNSYNCPLKSGDIFETKSQKKYILLMQPCEIMIRSNGKRSNDDYKCFANLVEISNDVTKKTDAELKYFNDETYYLQYSKIKKVELDILDLCSFSAEGKLEIDLNKTSFDHKLNGLSLRYNILQNKFNKMYNLWQSSGGLRELKIPLFTPNGKGILSLTINNQGQNKHIDFGLQRINKLSKDVAQELLSKLLTHLSRAAYDVDLAD